MLFRLSRRSLFRTRAGLARIAALVFIFWTLVDVLLVRRRLYAAVEEYRASAILKRPTRVYITSIHWNNEDVLREYWNSAILDLVYMFGAEDVFITVLESGSWDHSKEALRELDRDLEKLGVPRQITLDKTTHNDEISKTPVQPGNGWVRTARDKLELRRIPYLSRIRNQSLQALLDLAENGTTFDYVLFLNDVVFKAADVLNLLNTNDGHYAAACSLDFSKPPRYYDTFALRDAGGHEHASQTWPYFRSAASRNAMKQSKPVPVTSCWNGMVMMPAASFTGAKPLSFRGVDDSLAMSHLEGSECCLIHADNPASRTSGVWLNPNVRVGYSGNAYEKVHPVGPWLTIWEVWSGLWRNRYRRWLTTPWFKERKALRLTTEWERQEPDRFEPGTFCLINEMQVLVGNGWAHV